MGNEWKIELCVVKYLYCDQIRLKSYKRDGIVQDRYVLKLQFKAKHEDAMCIKKSVVFK